jgi:tryptophan 2,3-dioxygenase
MSAPQPVSYESYLKVREILELQKPLSQPEAHDELQFIVVHQVYELWFKLLLHEVRCTIGHLSRGEAGSAHWLMRRCIEIGRVLIQQIHVMETMSPAKFLEFRDCLKPASGLQSAQFRALEFYSGLKDPRYLELYPGEPASRGLLQEALQDASLWDGFVDLLKTRGFEVADKEQQLQALVEIYTNDSLMDLHLLAEAMIEYDEAFRIWRTRHYLMAERMIGFKPGTGVQHTDQMKMSGAQAFQDPGVQYLRGRAEHRYFPLLWEMRSRLGGGAYGG